MAVTPRKTIDESSMNTLTAFGVVSVSLMLIFYAFEESSHWNVLAFAAACAMASAYGFLQGAWPFGMVESVWSIVALRRWLRVRAEHRV
jgi:hypothetical protein